MKELITKWKEFSEDQNIRLRARNEDPNQFDWHLLGGTYIFSEYLYKSHQMELDMKYGVRERNWENFMDWVANGEKKFTGVIVKHEIKKD